MRRKVVIGFLGTTLDSGVTERRWERWRPSVALFAHDTFAVDTYEMLITDEKARNLADLVAKDVHTRLAPAAVINTHILPVSDPWDFAATYSALHEFAVNYHFREDCDYYVHLTTGTHVAQICLFILLEARYFPAKILQSSLDKGATEAPWKGQLTPIDINVAAYDKLAQRFERERASSQDVLKGGIATNNADFNALIARIERVALASKAPILLSGPTGAGKSLLAKRIFELRKRRHLVDGPLVEVNCATLRGDNAMSTLFGHKKGAFTGAVTDRPGMLKAADEGLLFLDEIGELGLDEQAMLLKALEDKCFRPLGSDKEVTSDFQLLAGTNRDLSEMVAKGTFREDLLARINLWDFKLPSLSERREDIEPNVSFETERVGRMLGKRVTWSTQALESFLKFAESYGWPGNFRDLGACVTRLATLAEGGRITEEDVKVEVAALTKAHPSKKQVTATRGYAYALKVFGESGLQEMDLVDIAQAEVILQVLARTPSMAEAGRELFAVSRSKRATTNDTDRIRKFLTGHGLEYAGVKQTLSM